VPVAPRLHPALPELYRAKVADLVAALDGDDATAAREQVRSLIEHITLHPENDGYRVEVRGEFSSILAMACGTHAKAASVSAAALSEQVKLVAGTRSPTNFLLPGSPPESGGTLTINLLRIKVDEARGSTPLPDIVHHPR
jgi:hypothetical protein